MEAQGPSEEFGTSWDSSLEPAWSLPCAHLSFYAAPSEFRSGIRRCWLWPSRRSSCVVAQRPECCSMLQWSQDVTRAPGLLGLAPSVSSRFVHQTSRSLCGGPDGYELNGVSSEGAPWCAPQCAPRYTKKKKQTTTKANRREVLVVNWTSWSLKLKPQSLSGHLPK